MSLLNDLFFAKNETRTENGDNTSNVLNYLITN